MKKTEAISILATSVRPREPKDRARYDEAVKMAIEALKCSGTPKSSERTAETAQNAQDKDLGWTILSKSIIPTLVPAGVVADIVQNQLHLEESIHRIKQLTGISIDDLLDLFAQGYELKAPSAQPEKQHGRIFQEIVVKYPSYNPYPERKGKPYFSIKYTENGQEFIGYGTYKPEVLSEYLKEYFMPSAQPEQRWIPCSKGLPETYGAYLVQDVCGGIFVDYWRGYWLAKTTMVAWMELPEPYCPSCGADMRKENES